MRIKEMQVIIKQDGFGFENQTAELNYIDMKTGGVRFTSGNVNGNINGINLSQEQIKEIKELKERVEKEIIEFFNKADFKIKCLSYNKYYIQGTEVKELKEKSEEIYKYYERKFLGENKRFFVEIERKIEAYEDDIIFYITADETEETEKVIEVKKENKEEVEIMMKNDEKLFIEERIEERNDIDYGKIGVTVRCLSKKVTVKRK